MIAPAILPVADALLKESGFVSASEEQAQQEAAQQQQLIEQQQAQEQQAQQQQMQQQEQQQPMQGGLQQVQQPAPGQQI
ncbi:hypothetical protein D3C87_1579040 [compost metagenome]